MPDHLDVPQDSDPAIQFIPIKPSDAWSLALAWLPGKPDH